MGERVLHHVTVAITCLHEQDGWIHPNLASFMLAWDHSPVRALATMRAG